MIPSKYVFIAVICLSEIVFAQFSKNLEITSYLDDNLYRSPLPVSDMFSNIDLSLDYRPESSTVNFSYNGNFFLYQDTRDRNFSLHSLSVSYFNPFGDEEQHTLYLGADGLLRFDTEQYNYYDYKQFYAYLNIRLDLNYLFFKTGYNFRFRDYANLPELTNNRHYAYIQLNKPFETRTTIILEANLGFKSFTGYDTYTTSSSGGKGTGMSQHATTTSQLTTPTSLSHLILLARVAQSLHDKFGLYFQIRKQMSLSDQFDFSNADSYYQDEELFDDPFSYESTGMNSQITWLLPWSTKLILMGEMTAKDYISEQAYVSAEDTIGLAGPRSDDQKILYLSLGKTFNFNKKWLNLLRFNLYMNFIDNQSNSYWYNFKNTVFGAGIEWNF